MPDDPFTLLSDEELARMVASAWVTAAKSAREAQVAHGREVRAFMAGIAESDLAYWRRLTAEQRRRFSLPA